MYLMVEKGTRGGVSMVSKRLATANNPLVAGFNSNEKTSYIQYYDANNLYAWAMSQKLPTGNFKFVYDVTKVDLTKQGMILEVDLEYPDKLHDEHNEYPLAPERMKVEKEWLSEYQLKLLGKTSLNIPKLVPNLQNKVKYVLHYKNLQNYIAKCMKLTKIHRAISFDESTWLKPYIEMNTELRKLATSDFDKNVYKLMNNAVFGKTMENLRKRVDVQIVRSSENIKIRKLLKKPNFANQKIFDHNLAALHMHKSKLLLNRPAYVGMCILDLSKLVMYDFYYDVLKKKYGDTCKLLYTDTDSLLLEIFTDDVYKDMEEQSEFYDTVNYPKDHFLYSVKIRRSRAK